VPLMGLEMHQLLATLCVALSLDMVALGGSVSTGVFHLQTLIFGRPLGNCGARFRYGCHIPQCRGNVVRGVGWRVSSFLLCLFTARAEPSRFASLVTTSWGYKIGGHSCATYILPHDLPISPRLLPYS
jgi:hypothetical protein